ncbi:MAG: hypothetical protein HPY75_01270 [Actinobacteria bacterium]|nr:hypothetical protein [Actinomycetota bacterium]
MGNNTYRVQHRFSFYLLLAFMLAAISLACSVPCLAADIKPPTDKEVEERISGSALTKFGWDIEERIEMHKVSGQGEDAEVHFYLYVSFTAMLSDTAEPGSAMAATAYDLCEWIGSASGTTFKGYTFNPSLYADMMGVDTSSLQSIGSVRDEDPEGYQILLSEVRGDIQGEARSKGLQPGWPVISVPGEETLQEESEQEEPAGEVTATEEDVEEGEGGKIPGPGSWWTWLTGTSVAGIIASLLSLLNWLFEPVTPPAPIPEVEPAPQRPPKPQLSESEKAERKERIRRMQESAMVTEGVFELTIKNIWEDLKKPVDWAFDKQQKSMEYLRNMMNDPARPLREIGEAHRDLMISTGRYIREDAARDISDGMTRLKDWSEQKIKGDIEAMREAARDPMKFLESMGKAQKEWLMSIAESLKKDPWGPIKTILGTDLWEKAMDYNNPLHVRFGYSALATLNTIGLLEGASGLKNWLIGGTGKTTGKTLVGAMEDKLDDALKAPKLLTYKEPKLLTYERKPLVAPKGKLSEADIRNIRKVRLTRDRPFFHDLEKASKGRLKTIWSNELQKAESKVKRFKRAMNSGDIRRQTEAVLEIQRDPLAIQKLSGKDKSTIRKFNRQIRRLQNEAMEETRMQIAQEFGVGPEDVEVFRATNPRDPGARVKPSMDQDLTIRIRQADGSYKDVAAADVQRIYDERFYEAAGRPQGITPEQLGRECRNVAVDRHSAEAFGMTPEDWENLQLGRTTSHTDTVARTLQFKADEAFTRADQLARSGDINGALRERWLGQRETVKAFNNQLKARADYLKRQGSPEKIADVNRKIADIEDTVRGMEKLLKEGAGPVKIDDFLRSKGTTAEDLARKISDTYRGLTP